MERDFQLLPAQIGFDEFVRMPEADGAFRHVVVPMLTESPEHCASTPHFGTGLRRGQAGCCAVADEKFTIAHEDDVMFDVIHRFARRKASMIVVVRGKDVSRAPMSPVHMNGFSPHPCPCALRMHPRTPAMSVSAFVRWHCHS